VLRKARAAPARNRLGDFFIVNSNGGIVAHHVDLRQLARELDVLQAYETTTEDSRPRGRRDARLGKLGGVMK
jgi:hypothetical protein